LNAARDPTPLVKASKAPKFTAGATLKATVSGKKT